MSFYLAVDAGGTKTDYALADDSHILARVRTGTIKRMRTDSATAIGNLEEALARLSAESGIGMHDIACTCVGAAGNTVPMVHDFYMKEFAERVSGRILVVNDVEIALDAAFSGGPGVLVLAGTGSNVAGRNEAGDVTTAGGWGPALADQGSGHRIGHEGLRSAFLAMDEGQPTVLLQAIQKFWDLASVDDLVDYANRIPAPDFSLLTRLIVQCALAGDVAARRALQREAQDLAHLAALVVRRLQRASARPDWVPLIAFAGSILENIPAVREALIEQLANEFARLRTVPGVVDPIEGAAWRARNHATPPHS